MYSVSLSPRQRFALLAYLHAPGREVKDRAEGRRMRRLCQALGLDIIKASLDEFGSVSAAYASSRKAAAFEISSELADAAHSLFSGTMPISTEEVCGDFFDTLAAIKNGNEPPEVTCSPFNADDDRRAWTPPSPRGATA